MDKNSKFNYRKSFNSRGRIRERAYWLETLKKDLDKNVLTLEHMKLEIGNITMKYIMGTH